MSALVCAHRTGADALEKNLQTRPLLESGPRALLVLVRWKTSSDSIQSYDNPVCTRGCDGFKNSLFTGLYNQSGRRNGEVHRQTWGHSVSQEVSGRWQSCPPRHSFLGYLRWSSPSFCLCDLGLHDESHFYRHADINVCDERIQRWPKNEMNVKKL